VALCRSDRAVVFWLTVAVTACAARHSPEPAPIRIDPPQAEGGPAPAAVAEPSADAEAPPSEPVSDAAESCTGQATPELLAALRTRSGEARACYAPALRADPKLQGRMSVVLRIADDGGVTSVDVLSEDMENEPMLACVKGLFARRFSTPAAGPCIQVVIPLRFQPKPVGRADGGP
jgi:hypothetical protein